MTETETPNPSVARGTNRVSHWAFRVVALLAILLNGSMMPILGQSITVQNTSIHEGDAVSAVSEFTIDFDFSAAAIATGKNDTELGIASGMKDMDPYRLLVYKGGKDSEYVGTVVDATNENVIGYGYKTISKTNVVAGMHSITIPMVNAIEFENGQKYTIYISGRMFRAAIPGTLYSNTYLNDPIVIEFIGGKSEENVLKLTSFSPSSDDVLKSLTEVKLQFNQNVSLNENAIASISVSGKEVSSTTDVTCSENEVTIVFEDATLYNGKDYIVTIPANSILSSDGSQSMDAISLFYKGGAYQYMNTGRVYPSVNNPVSWLSTVKIPFVFPEGYNIGKVESANVRLYEGSMESEPMTLSLGESNDLNSLTVDVWKFDLKPNTTYYVVLDKEQIFPARSDDYRIKLKDTTNDDVILAYTTPAENEMEHPEPVAVTVIPKEGEDNDRLDVVTFNLPDYEFENSTYLVQVLTENPVAIFNDGTNETTLPLTFNASSKKATCAINRPLESGKTYTLKVPAGTFAPNAHSNLAAVAANDELVYTYTGKAVPATEYVTVTYTIEGVSAMRHEVEKGKAVSFTLTPADELWTVGNVENATLDEGSGKYVTAPLEADHEVKASFALVNPVEFDFTTEVDEIEGELAHSIYSDGNNLVVNGVTGGDRIRVYTTAGALMADKTVPEGMDTASISLDHGVYIVAVNTHVYKARH